MKAKAATRAAHWRIFYWATLGGISADGAIHDALMGRWLLVAFDIAVAAVAFGIAGNTVEKVD